ncbi:MAG: penicillin acylase family protein [Candidatus Binatia bacterium]
MGASFSALLRPLIHRLAQPSFPLYEGTLTLAGLQNKVEVRWDDYGIPRVFAANEHDLFLAQGYLHAQERLWQMDLTRCFLSGRTAEIFGRFPVPWKELSTHFRNSDSANFDYFMRLIGIRQSAIRSLEILRQEDRERLQAYSDGVNRYIENCGKRLPWEFRLLRYRPVQWHPEDSLTIGKGFAFLLSPALFTRLNMIALAAKLRSQQQKLRSLFPTYPDDGPSITKATWDSAQALWQFMSGTFSSSDWSPAGLGSNNWVIAPERSASGNALLCNDPHLRLTLPSVWYLMHLKAEPTTTQADGYEVWGASIPGTPCIHVGCNRSIAWGVTAALCDDVELYREKIDPLEPDRYFAGRQWLKMDSRLETIRIRGKGEIKRTVRRTRHGPVISDFQGSTRSPEILALRWTAHEPSQDFRCVYAINRARNWDEFLDGLAHQVAPNLNYVYADQQGNIGYSLAGKIPIRPKAPTLMPVEGWRPENDWRGYVPFSELPRLYNPPEGVLATANHRIADDSYPHFLSHLFEPPYRINRIKQFLTTKTKLSVEDMVALQGDLISLQAKEIVQALQTDLEQVSIEFPDLHETAGRLLRWDGHCGAESTEAAIFHVFYYRLMANLLVPVLGEDLFLGYTEIFNQCIIPIDQILKDPASVWFDGSSRRALVTKSLSEASNELAGLTGADIRQWQWGRIHTLMLDHNMSRISVFKPILSIGPFASPGDNLTVNMGFQRHSNPYRHIVGASTRLIIELGNPLRLKAVLLPGQSGHPFSPHYGDQTELWRNGGYISLVESSEKVANERRLILIPA